MELILDPDFLEDLRFGAETDAKVAVRVLKLLEEIGREPFRGSGKPEPLKHLGAGVWSRRVTQADRLVYRVGGDRVNLLQRRFHY
jgi:toxin YoeB